MQLLLNVLAQKGKKKNKGRNRSPDFKSPRSHFGQWEWGLRMWLVVIRNMQLGDVPQACYSSYLGGKDKEGHNLRPAWEKSLPDPVSTNVCAQWYVPVSPSCVGKHK
jgi:hypothetical protein